MSTHELHELPYPAQESGLIRMALIPVDGSDVMLAQVRAGDIAGMAELIGAEYVERVKVADGWSMALDEEGLIRGRDDNGRAQALYPGRIVGDALLAREAIVGDGCLDWVDTTPGDLLVFLAERGALR